MCEQDSTGGHGRHPVRKSAYANERLHSAGKLVNEPYAAGNCTCRTTVSEIICGGPPIFAPPPRSLPLSVPQVGEEFLKGDRAFRFVGGF